MPEGTSGNVAVYAHSSEDPMAAETMVHVAENVSFTPPPLPERGSSQSLDESLTRIKSALSVTVFTVPPPAPYCYWVAAMACLNSCNLGYDVGSVGGAALLMQEEFGWSSGQLSFYIGMLVDYFETRSGISLGKSPLFCHSSPRPSSFCVPPSFRLHEFLLHRWGLKRRVCM